MNALSPITRNLLIANIGVFVIQYFSGDGVVYRFALWPWDTPLFHVWQLVTYSFMHGSPAHLFFNMFALYMFGSEIERVLGTQRYLIYYFASVVGAAALHLIVTRASGLVVPTVGASGGVFGLLLAFGMFFPQRRIMLLIPPIPMKAWVFVTLYGLAELAMGVFGTHLGGMLTGFLLLNYWRSQKTQGSQ
jgi:membrane associated rhomboid family serine protease